VKDEMEDFEGREKKIAAATASFMERLSTGALPITGEAIPASAG
jgi:hypothetical protein